MSVPRVSSYSLLNVAEDRWEDVVWYMDSLQDLHDDIRTVEQEVHAVTLDTTGYHSHQRIDQIDQRYQAYRAELEAARSGIVDSQPRNFDRWDGNWNSNETREGFDKCRGELLNEIERIESTLDRVGQTILSKRNAANTRMIVVLSGLAVGISLISLFVPRLL